MKKSYRLIKEYPNSPILGTILEHPSDFTDLIIKNIQNYPEFWGEITEKEYEILSFVNNGNKGGEKGFITLPQKNGTYGVGGYTESAYGMSLEATLNCNFLDIYSVKRLSDGEIFTVGDEIIYNEVFPIKLKIKSIQLFNNEILIHKDNTMNTNKLSEISHCKKLFTTEDGVDIYNGDKSYVVSKEYKNSPIACYTFDNIVIHYLPDRNLYFSTKEKAEEYILLHKECLSLNDIYSVLDKTSRLADNIKNLAKKKLQ